MKSLFSVLVLLFLTACEATPEPKVGTDALPTGGDHPISASADTSTVKEPDCDEKAKKKVEISETEFKLGGGDTGCKLE